MWRGACLVVFASALLLGGGGCGALGGGCSCSSHPRDALFFKPLNGTGTVHWSGGASVVDGGAASDGTCVALLELAPQGACGFDAPDFTVRLDCKKPNLPNAGFVVDAGDVPKLPPGDHAVVASNVYPAPAGSPTITLRVESKTGGVGGNTDAHTADFDEKVTLEVVSSTLTALLDFEITASQLVQGSRTCQVCAC